ncbi:hypothetical protein AK830_g6910 [Neonectria ditissima]|uniref:F-box domain-containing protein n=1 Tax=Neonectria ditissima TaxID=78410 RepID=A0A0P7AYG6_9HYPO|nr:hypothetical protein AK830_g6910 [Neonectria ditissima]
MLQALQPSQRLAEGPTNSGINFRLRMADLLPIGNKSNRPSNDKVQTSLRDMPPETLIEIATVLNPVDRASFALACRQNHQVMGRALRLDATARLQLLCRLERGGLWLKDILCSSCCRFHPPRQDRQWTTKEGDRECVKNGTSSRLKSSHSPFLPAEVHFDVVAAIMRCQRFGATHYGVDLLASRRLYSCGEAKIGVVVSARTLRGRLFLKKEMFLFAGKTRATALHKAPELMRLLLQQRQLDDICEHSRWACSVCSWIFGPDSIQAPARRPTRTQAASLFPDQDPPTRPPTQTQSQQGFDIPGQTLQECLWTHEPTCWTRCDASPRLQANLARTVSCNYCPTDFKVSTLHLENTRPETTWTKVLVFTSWKDLGSGGSVDDQEWQSHLQHRPDFCAFSNWRTHPFESVQSWFENGRDGGSSVPYTPRLLSRAMEEFLT